MIYVKKILMWVLCNCILCYLNTPVYVSMQYGWKNFGQFSLNDHKILVSFKQQQQQQKKTATTMLPLSPIQLPDASVLNPKFKDPPEG